MTAAIAAGLPFALGVLASPLPILAMILILLGERARRAGPAFATGWLAGLLGLGLVGILVINRTPLHDDGSGSPWARAITAAVGVTLLYFALSSWRGRPKPGVEPEQPAWMARLSGVGTGRAFGLGIALAAIKPKNLVLGLAAAAAIGETGVPLGQELVGLLVFALIASIGVLAPLAAYLALGSRAHGVLKGWGDWLTRHNAVVVAVVLLALGVVLLVKVAMG